MSVLNVTFQSKGKASNLAEIGDQVMVIFTQPPTSATNVKVEVHEMPGAGDEVQSDRLLATYSGQITGGKFKLDAVGGGDPLNPITDNPVIESYKRKGTCQFDLQFADDPKKNLIPMPDIEDENGRYELQFKVTGSINGTPTTAAGMVTLNLSLWRDVMLVSDAAGASATQKKSKDFTVFSDNAQFGEQWRKFAGARRAVIKVPIDATIQTFEALMNQAAPMAAHGDIILSVGHGHEGDGKSSESAFDLTPSTVVGLSNHPNVVTETLLNLPSMATRDSSGKWTAKPNITPPSGMTAQQYIDKLGDVYEALTRIGNVMSQNKVARFIILTCRMGGDSSFRHNLTGLLKTHVGAYDAYVVTGGGDGQSIQMWKQDEHDPTPPLKFQPPIVDAPNDSSFHEIPGGLL